MCISSWSRSLNQKQKRNRLPMTCAVLSTVSRARSATVGVAASTAASPPAAHNSWNLQPAGPAACAASAAAASFSCMKLLMDLLLLLLLHRRGCGGLTFSRRALPGGGGRGVACACGVRDDRASSSGEGPATCAGAAAAGHTVRAPGCDFTARATK